MPAARKLKFVGDHLTGMKMRKITLAIVPRCCLKRCHENLMNLLVCKFRRVSMFQHLTSSYPNCWIHLGAGFAHTHTTYSHTICPHTTYSHTICPHTTYSLTTCQHTTWQHTTYSHTTYTHTLAQNGHCEFCCGMHLACTNTPITPDRNGSTKRPDQVSKKYHRHSQCRMKNLEADPSLSTKTNRSHLDRLRKLYRTWNWHRKLQKTVWMANPDIPLCDLTSLTWVSQRVPSSPAKLKSFTSLQTVHLFKAPTNEMKVKMKGKWKRDHDGNEMTAT